MPSVRRDEFVVERGEDVWVWDSDGERYLDATAGLWFANVGHGRREIADAAARQMRRLAAYSAFGDFATAPALELADRLGALAPFDGARVFLGSGGADGVDTAAKIARRYWCALGEPRRTHLLSRTHGYHGTHGYGTSLAGIQANRDGFGGLDADASRVAHDSVAELKRAIERIGPERIAAFFVEPVIGAGGVYPPPTGYLEGVAEVCRAAGILLIVDSVICGFGRLGCWWGVERFGIEPDMVVFAKGVTSGYLPLGGVLASGRVSAPFWERDDAPVLRHGATYAGHASCCAAALTNLEILEREQLIQRGRELEGPLFDALAPLGAHDAVTDVRGGTGLLAAVELSPALLADVPGAVAQVFARCREAGVLVRALATSLAVSPALTADRSHFDLIAEALDQAIIEVAEAVPC
jgi:adenosylmethionine-8-amino-7-oxononanoate aminotransferase